ncbi:MAG: 16S rRNA (cytidine(1402)-2'-O)-methyltransferase [Ignavibacteriae bacterium]|nr:MAG: 16S rRNA (cytidine(1402)-2'-O)-methyltransferase [Ignavibacteriota bacterium]
MSGILYLVAIPIGNYDDITLRALTVLKSVDVVVCEERSEGLRLLRHYGIDQQVEMLNEHNELAAASIMLDLLNEGKSIALISDAGTPVFSDPGRLLVEKAIRQKIKLVPVPGASSLLPALIVSGFPIKEFVFAGFLSPKRERRLTELRDLRKEQRTIVLMDTPYRLVQLLRDMADVYGETRRVCVAFDLTLPTEEIYHSTAPRLYQQFLKEEKKGEFVIVLEGK